MDTLSHLAFGLGVALTWQNLAYCFAGCLLGTMVGVLPGVGPVTTVAMLLPFTFGLGPAPALIMLAGIYYGAQYGGSTTAILVNIPGESSSVVTTIDGYQMARNGQAGPALGIAAIGSFIAGCFATLVIAYFAPPLAEIALNFGPADYFSLMILGLVASVVLARGSLIKAIAMVCFGILLGLVGTDVNSGAIRFGFGRPELTDGIGFVALAMAFFGITDVLLNLEQNQNQDVFAARIGRILPSVAEFRQCMPTIGRSTVLGSILGILPGGGALLASFAAYMLEKKIAKPPCSFGSGDIRGVAAPESANNAGAQTSFIPMLTLGVPSNPTMAMMIGALMIQGITPGPGVMNERPDLFWGLIASMWVGNLMLLVLNLPLVGLWIRLLSIPYRMMFPAIFVFCCIGAYSVNSEVFDIYTVAALSGVGYILLKLDCEPAPMVLGFVLGPMLEENLRRTMMISFGDASVFVTRPISAACLVATVLVLVAMVLPTLRQKRDEVMVE
ncbi:tripartite tricarboxylate transporter permease [Roseiarcaceae bacterium H3SJ34-1]|uniref:tripartite tricarboxylate transporter permease n=1 Tax=Terripilifer ovatus TaxID=3032367 RepID=UPI003AB96AF6|nr:tripartite tricarboxylate transporter permease [Roseiarcaceae bacterium H3SJ34-1]